MSKGIFIVDVISGYSDTTGALYNSRFCQARQWNWQLNRQLKLMIQSDVCSLLNYYCHTCHFLSCQLAISEWVVCRVQCDNVATIYNFWCRWSTKTLFYNTACIVNCLLLCHQYLHKWMSQDTGYLVFKKHLEMDDTCISIVEFCNQCYRILCVPLSVAYDIKCTYCI